MGGTRGYLTSVEDADALDDVEVEDADGFNDLGGEDAGAFNGLSGVEDAGDTSEGFRGTPVGFIPFAWRISLYALSSWIRSSFPFPASIVFRSFRLNNVRLSVKIRARALTSA